MDAAEREAWREADRHLASLLELDEIDRDQALTQLDLDPDIRAKLERLLANTQRKNRLLDDGVITPPGGLVTATEPLPSGHAVGEWRLLGLLGHGGMASVYRAERVGQDFSQQAAIKLLHRYWHGPAEQARFRRERQILARLRHPHIAALLDGGIATDDTPYLAMALIEGERIDNCADRLGLTPRQRVELMLGICDATAYAHRQLVIHRDIKPGNILVDTAGHATLLDFGIARILDDTNRDSTVTQAFTPDYAAPEQRAGNRDLGTAVDVYGLGAVLHRLLTGVAPRIGNHDEPLPASQAARQAGHGQWARGLTGDLDAILALALANEPAQRYASVDALHSDLTRWLQHRPVAARKRSWRRRLVKLVRRNPLSTSLALTSLLLALGGALLLFRGHRQLERHANQLQQVADFQSDMLAKIDASQLGSRLDRDTTAALRKLSFLSEAELQQVQAKTDFTGIAAGLIDQALLKPAVETTRLRFANQPELKAALLQTLAGSYRHLFKLDAAQSIQDQATRLFLDTLGPGDRRSLASLREQVELAEHRSAADLVPLAERSLALHLRALGDADPDTAKARLRLGSALVSTDAARAEAELKRVLAQLDGNPHAAIATRAEARAALAVAIAEQNRYAEAEPIFRAAIEDYAHSHGANDSDTLELRNMLAWVHGRLDQGEQAHAAYLTLYPLYLDAFGEFDPRSLNLLNNIAAWPRRHQDYAAAEAPLRKAWNGLTLTVGPDHPNTIRVQINLAEVELKLGRPARARQLLEAALVRTGQEDLHDALPGAQRLLGMTALAEGRRPEAIAWLTKAWHSAAAESQTGLQQATANQLATLHRQTPDHERETALWQSRAKTSASARRD